MMHIERLTHLATDGDPTAEAHANRERRRRGLPLVWFACPLLDGQCGGVKHEPPMTTLEELREWAEVEFFADGLTADISTQAFTGWAGVFLYRIDAPTPRRRQLASVWLSADGRPRFRFFDVVVERSNNGDFCPSVIAIVRAPSDQYDRTGLCRQSKRSTHNSRRQCCPLPL